MGIGGKDRVINEESKGKRMIVIGQRIAKLWAVEVDHKEEEGRERESNSLLVSRALALFPLPLYGQFNIS